MAALPHDVSMIDPGKKPAHDFCAEAYVLSADLEQPLDEEITPRSQVVLPKDGHYQFKKVEPFRFEGILSYESGYTQVAGYPSSKTVDSKSIGFVTLATSVLEGLNVLDVVTADRVVAQISTLHPEYGKGPVPSVTFLGTRFENLRIDGHKVDVGRDLDILGARGDHNRSYFDDDEVKSRISQQNDRIASVKNLPEWASKEYPRGRPAVNGSGELSCSVVNSLKGCPGTSFGHVIDLPHFGKIFLGELEVERIPGNPSKEMYDTYKFHLTMIRLEMGCLAEGKAKIVALDSNGRGGKGGGG
jgi:hypothetical protein